MQTLGVQFEKIMQKRANKLHKEAGEPFLIEIFKRMNALTSGGKSFKDLRYVSQYGTRHSKVRTDAGYQTSYVDLRMGKKRIEYYQLQAPSTKQAEIGFRDGGSIFYYHQFGKVLNGNNVPVYREIFPKVWLNVPDDIKADLIKRVVAVMSGINAKK